MVFWDAFQKLPLSVRIIWFVAIAFVGSMAVLTAAGVDFTSQEAAVADRNDRVQTRSATRSERQAISDDEYYGTNNSKKSRQARRKREREEDPHSDLNNNDLKDGGSFTDSYDPDNPPGLKGD